MTSRLQEPGLAPARGAGCITRNLNQARPSGPPLKCYPNAGSGLHGFTLIEVLATMLLMAIVLPVVMRGISTATLAAGITRHRTEAAGLAQSKLSELTVSGLWQGGVLSGDFGPNCPEYKWTATVVAWPNDTQSVGLQQLDVQVWWTARSRQESITVSGLVYERPTPTS